MTQSIMDDRCQQLIEAFIADPNKLDIVQQITILLKDTNCQLPPFTDPQFIQTLISLEHWAWETLSQPLPLSINEIEYQELFHALSSLNMRIAFSIDTPDADTKARLLFAVTVDQIDQILNNIELGTDDNSPYFTLVHLIFESQSYFLFENPMYSLPIIDQIGQRIIDRFIFSTSYKFYLAQLRQSNINDSIFTKKLLFYISTCSFYTYSYLVPKCNDWSQLAVRIIELLREDYLEIIHVHASTVALWSREFLSCVAHLISFIVACEWWDIETKISIKILCPDETTACDHVQQLVQIISYQSFYHLIKPMRSNEETMLIQSVLTFLIMLIHNYDLSWLFREITILQHTISSWAENTVNHQISLCGYDILGEVLTEEQLKDLKIVDDAGTAFFNILENSWNKTGKIYKDISIQFLLKGFVALSKNDCVQQKTADAGKTLLFVEMVDEFPIAYDIIWSLSFNHDIRQQLRSNKLFMRKVLQLSQKSDSEKMTKVIHGILWNLELNQKPHHQSLDINDQHKFDIMISYSHKEKSLCKQIYEELTKAGYRVWIDFDQMHGNVMDAMAQAIEYSRTVIICMSEHYRKSSYCRAEAQYAFQQQRKIIPILIQQHYKPDGWLLFLVGSLLYVDFNKHAFCDALNMLFKEVQAVEGKLPLTESKEENIVSTPTVSISSCKKEDVSKMFASDMLEWGEEEVQKWLLEHNLVQMHQLLKHCDGRALVYLKKYMNECESRKVLNLLEEDANRRLHEKLSLIELCKFNALMDQQRKIFQSSNSKQSKKIDIKTDKK